MFGDSKAMQRGHPTGQACVTAGKGQAKVLMPSEARDWPQFNFGERDPPMIEAIMRRAIAMSMHRRHHMVSGILVYVKIILRPDER